MRRIFESTPLRPSDLSAFQTYRSDPVIARSQDWEPMTDKQASGFLTYVATVRPILCAGQWVQIAVADVATDRGRGPAPV